MKIDEKAIKEMAEHLAIPWEAAFWSDLDQEDKDLFIGRAVDFIAEYHRILHQQGKVIVDSLDLGYVLNGVSGSGIRE